MKFKIDENLPVEVAATLSEYGHDAETVWDESLPGATGQFVSMRARVLLTLDLDFANIQTYPPAEHSGIIVLRLKAQDKVAVVRYVRRLAAVIQRRSPFGELWIVESDRIRIRPS